MSWVFRQAKRLFSMLNKETLEALGRRLQQQPNHEVLKPYLTADNATALFHLITRSKLGTSEKQQALLQLDRVARLETELQLNIAANIKKQLSVGFLRERDFPRAKEYGEDGLNILRMMAEPHPVEIATFLQELAEVYYASQRKSDKAYKFSTQAIQLFEEALKLEPDNKALVVNLAYSYTRVCWHYIFAGDLLKAQLYSDKASELWSRTERKDLKIYAFFVQGRCLLLHRLKQKEEASAAAKEIVEKQQLDQATLCWFLTLLVKNGDKESEAELAAVLKSVQGRMPPQSFENFKQVLESMFG